MQKKSFFWQKWPIYMLVQNISRGHESLKTFWNFGAPYWPRLSYHDTSAKSVADDFGDLVNCENALLVALA